MLTSIYIYIYTQRKQVQKQIVDLHVGVVLVAVLRRWLHNALSDCNLSQPFWHFRALLHLDEVLVDVAPHRADALRHRGRPGRCLRLELPIAPELDDFAHRLLHGRLGHRFRHDGQQVRVRLDGGCVALARVLLGERRLKKNSTHAVNYLNALRYFTVCVETPCAPTKVLTRTAPPN